MLILCHYLKSLIFLIYVYFIILAQKTSKTDKSESKHFENKHTSNVVHANTPENSPKRKRTRHTPSAQPSPASTPDTPATKRRR